MRKSFNEPGRSRNVVLKGILVISLLLAVSPAFKGQPADIGKRLKGLDQKIEKILKEWNIPGCGIGIVSGDKLLYAKGYGYRNLEKKLPVTSNTLFQIASNTKLFTATSVGFLAEEGKIEWDRPVKLYVPSIEFFNDELNASVTIRDMLSHRTGISRHDGIWYNSSFSRKELFDRIKYLEPSIPIRTGYLYNNLMYAASGYIIELLTGMTWEAYVKEKIFVPLGMQSSIFDAAAMQQSPDFMKPYYEKRDTTILLPLPVYTAQDGIGPAGAIISNVNDLSNWVMAQLHGGKFMGKQVIPSSVIRETLQPAIPASSVPARGQMENLNSIYGMGRITSSYKGHYRAQHGGAIGGIYSNISVFPSDTLGIIVFTNRLSSLPALISNVIADQLLGLEPTDWSGRSLTNYLKNKETQKASRKNQESDKIAGTIPSHDLKDYAGQYEDRAYGVIDISLRDENLWFKYNNTILPLNHYHYDRFVTPDDELEGKTSVLFTMDAQGNISNAVISMDEKEVVFVRKPDKKLTDPLFLKKLEGNYELNGATLAIVFRNGALVIAASPPQHLLPYRNNTFRIKEFSDQTVEFVLDDDQTPAAIKITADGKVLRYTRKK